MEGIGREESDKCMYQSVAPCGYQLSLPHYPPDWETTSSAEQSFDSRGQCEQSIIPEFDPIYSMEHLLCEQSDLRPLGANSDSESGWISFDSAKANPGRKRGRSTDDCALSSNLGFKRDRVDDASHAEDLTSVVGVPGMPEPARRPTGPKLKFNAEDDALLVELVEVKQLTWKQVADFFPGRSPGTLQVRYLTKLKAKRVEWSDVLIDRLHEACREYTDDKWRIISGKVGHGVSASECKSKSQELAENECQLVPAALEAIQAVFPTTLEIMDLDNCNGDKTKLTLVDTIRDTGAIFEPDSYYEILDDLEEEVVKMCQRALQILDGGSQSVQTIERKSLALCHVLSAMERMTSQGFCANVVQVLVQDPRRLSVLQVVDVAMDEIQSIVKLLEKDRYYEGALAAQKILLRLNIVAGPCEGTVCLLTRICAQATIAFMGSFTSDFACRSIDLERTYTTTGRRLKFYLQELACLGGYIGEPVWVFGAEPLETPAYLSILVSQLANMWGPLFSIPSKQGKGMWAAIKTENGILYHSPDRHLPNDIATANGEILMHWASTSPILKMLNATESDKSLMLSVSDRAGGHAQPPFPSFDPTSQLLIGGSDGSHITTECPADGLQVNPDCTFNRGCFAQMNCSNFHASGTHDGYYAPDELQLAFSAGQYVSVGCTKVWKHIAPSTYKTRILFWLSSHREAPDDIRRLFALRIGFEMSACTRNARRVSLYEALLAAFPCHEAAIQKANRTGCADQVFHLITELSFTGVSPRGTLQLFWPSETSREIYEIEQDRPRWRDIVKDTRDTACFAVLSPLCLIYQGVDEVNSSIVHKSCSSGTRPRIWPVFQTAIGLSLTDINGLPLRKGQDIQLSSGRLRARNSKMAPLVVYERGSVIHIMQKFRKGRQSGFCQEHVDTQKTAGYVVSVYIVDS